MKKTDIEKGTTSALALTACYLVHNGTNFFISITPAISMDGQCAQSAQVLLLIIYGN